MDEATEREHIRLCVEVQHKVIGTRPLGIYQGKPNANTLKLVAYPSKHVLEEKLQLAMRESAGFDEAAAA